MTTLDERLTAWVADAVGFRPVGACGLRDGGAPWLLRFDGRSEDVVLRIGSPGDPALLATELAGMFDLGAADHVLAAWEGTAGRDADDVAYWDVVAALSTPPDMRWFASAIGGQARTDLTQPLLVRRRDNFLRTALDRL